MERIPQNPRKTLPVQAVSMSTSILIPKDIVTVRHLNQKGFKCELYDYLKTSQIKLFKKTAEKCDSDSKDYMVSQNLGNNKPQLVLVHHLRFFGTKRSLEHQDGAKDKGITQIHLFIQEILRVLTNMLLKSSFNSSHGLNILIHIHEDPH